MNFFSSKNKLLLLLAFLASFVGHAQIVKSKLIDNGGSGHYKSIAATEKSLPDFVIYRPENLAEASKKEGRLPVFVWANGGCMDSSIHQEKLLSEVASYGYVIVAIGALQMTMEEREHQPTPNDELLKAMDWITAQAKTKGNDYYKKVDINKMAAGGHSCGGAQTFRIADDARIKTYLILNAGMGNMSMAGASSKSLKNLHGPTIYIIGGESDVAYQNAIIDYDNIHNVPVAFADHSTAGHGATFSEKYGGSFAQMTIDWLDWQLKGKDNSNIFLNKDLSDYPGWTMKAKGFNKQIKDSTSFAFTKPELGFVCELKVTTDEPLTLGKTPKGEKIIVPITGGTFEGPNMKGIVLKGGADYQYFNNGLNHTELEAIYTIKTDDGVLIHVRNTGLLYTPQKDENPNIGESYFRTTPKFEAPSDSKYAWLNNALFICKPESKNGYISLQVWKVL